VPVGDGGICETGLEAVGKFEHGVNDGMRAVIAAPDTDALRINVRLNTEEADDFAEVDGFLRAEAVVNVLFEQVRIAAGAADVDGEDKKAAADYGTVPRHLPAAPGIRDDVAAWAGEGVKDNGVSLVGIEV